MKMAVDKDLSPQNLPRNWQEVMLRFLLREPITDGPHETPEFISEGIPFLSVDGIQDGELELERTRFISHEQHQIFIKKAKPQRDDILFGKAASTGKIARVKTDQEFSIWSPLALLRPDQSKVLPAYLEYALKSPAVQSQIDLLCTSSTQKNISMDAIPRIRIAVPPLDVQQRISKRLESENLKLSTLVEHKNRLLGTLIEKRRAVIADFLTKGLNKDAPHRDSEIPWLGEIPAHWQTERAKWLFTERDDRSDSGDEELLTVSHLTGVTSRAEKDVNMFMAESLEGYKRCQAGDLVINTLWAWMGAMGVARQPGIVSPAYNVYQPVAQFDPEYVDLLVRTPRFVEEITRYSKGVWSSRLRLYPEGLYEAWLPVPPLDEQRAIVAHVQTETKKLDALAEATERTITLLQERRSALISAAVTGELEIGEASI